MIRILHFSDGHGYLPAADPTLNVNLVCVTGDDSGEYHGNIKRQIAFCEQALTPALAAWSCPVLGTAGNHNQAAESEAGRAAYEAAFAATGGAYLIDEGMEIMGLNVYASPWTLPTRGGAFAGSENELAAKWAGIGEGLDLLLTHSPPYGWRDHEPGTVASWGSTSLREHVTWARPRAHLFGHAHSGAGVDASYATTFSNGSLVGRGLAPVGGATILTMHDDGSVEAERVQLELIDYLGVA